VKQSVLKGHCMNPHPIVHIRVCGDESFTQTARCFSEDTRGHVYKSSLKCQRENIALACERVFVDVFIFARTGFSMLSLHPLH